MESHQGSNPIEILIYTDINKGPHIKMLIAALLLAARNGKRLWYHYYHIKNSAKSLKNNNEQGLTCTHDQ